MYHLGTRGTGQFEHVSTENKIPDFDTRTGDHFWSVMVAFAIRDPEKMIREGEQALLDHENIVQVTPIACMYCAVAYSPRTKLRRCTNKIPDDV